VTPTGAIVTALGGGKVLRGRVSSLSDLQEEIRAGLPFSALESLLEAFALTREEVSVALKIPLRTIARRKTERRLSADESDKLVRLARIAVQTSEVLGAAEKAAQWLKRENRALGDRAPLGLLDTEIGARQVEDVLGRIAHGVHS